MNHYFGTAALIDKTAQALLEEASRPTALGMVRPRSTDSPGGPSSEFQVRRGMAASPREKRPSSLVHIL